MDQHNQQFIKLVNIICQQFTQGGVESRSVLLNTLVSLSRFHFKYEERWMAKVGYPELSGHKKEHDVFMNRIVSCAEGDAEDDDQLLQFLLDWTLEHLTLHNPKVKPYASECCG